MAALVQAAKRNQLVGPVLRGNSNRELHKTTRAGQNSLQTYYNFFTVASVLSADKSNRPTHGQEK